MSVLSVKTDHLDLIGDTENDSILFSLNWSMTDVSLPEALESAGEHTLRLLRGLFRRGVVIPCDRDGEGILVFGIVYANRYLKFINTDYNGFYCHF